MVSKYLIISLIGFLNLNEVEVPYLEQEMYSYELTYSFKKRPAPDPNTYNVGGGTLKYDASPLPYLEAKITCSFDKNRPFKYQVQDNTNGTIKQKRLKDDKEVIELDFGFNDDIKDRVGPYQFTVLFLNDDKEPISRIVFEFTEDGDMLVNGEVRGKI